MIDRTCGNCGTVFSAHKRTARYCGELCRQAVRVEAKRIARYAAQAGKACPICGESLAQRNVTAKYCSKSCSDVAYGNRLPGPLPERECEWCGVTFRPQNRVQACCSEDHGRRNCYRRRDMNGDNKAAMACDQCGVVVVKRKFRTDRLHQFCSLTCRNDHQFRESREYQAAHSVLVPFIAGDQYCVIPDIHPARVGHAQAPRIFVAGNCARCREPFTARGQVAARFCSTRCAGAKRRRRAKRKFSVSVTVRKDIYVRDKLTCQLCFNPVDMRLPHEHRMAATLDHIICQSHTDTPDHSPGNLRLAHRLCNSIRNDERSESWMDDIRSSIAPGRST